MTPNLLNDFANIAGVGAVFVLIEELLPEEERHRIGASILTALTTDGAPEDEPYFLPAIANVFGRIFGSTSKFFATAIGSWLVYNIFFAVYLYCFDPEFRSSFSAITRDASIRSEFYFSLAASGVAAVMFLWLFRYILSVFYANFSISRAFVIVSCCAALGLISFSICRLIIKGPVSYIAGYARPAIVPMQLVLEPPTSAFVIHTPADGPRVSQRSRLIFKRTITNAEREVIKELYVREGGVPEHDVKDWEVGLDFSKQGTILDEKEFPIYRDIVKDIDFADACGKSLVSVASTALGLNTKELRLTGDKNAIIDCKYPEKRTVAAANLIFDHDTFDNVLWLGYGFAINTRTVYTYQIDSARGIEFISGFYVDKVLTRERTKIFDAQRFRELKKMFDVRQIEVSLLTRATYAQRTMEIGNMMFSQVFLLVPAVGVLMLVMFANARPLDGSEQICRAVYARPLSVLALLFFLVLATIYALRGIFAA